MFYSILLYSIFIEILFYKDSVSHSKHVTNDITVYKYERVKVFKNSNDIHACATDYKRI